MVVRWRFACAVAVLLLPALVFGAGPQWTPAEYKGLKLGHTRRDDVVRVMGTPDAVNHQKDGDEMVYRGRGDHKGDVTVRLDRSGMVTEVQEAFPISIPRTRIYKELGNDAMTAHFSKAKCAKDELYRDPRGAIELTLYPQKGIVLWPDQYGYDFAAELYLAKGPGLNRAPECVKRQKQP